MEELRVHGFTIDLELGQVGRKRLHIVFPWTVITLLTVTGNEVRTPPVGPLHFVRSPFVTIVIRKGACASC
eukprot:10650326-Heterocapsa_arctica.AAC.1